MLAHRGTVQHNFDTEFDTSSTYQEKREEKESNIYHNFKSFWLPVLWVYFDNYIRFFFLNLVTSFA